MMLAPCVADEKKIRLIVHLEGDWGHKRLDYFLRL